MIIPLHPVAVILDRYSGAYSGGRWLAVAHADVLSRWVTILNEAHGGDDLAIKFWESPPVWVAAGKTPGAAIDALEAKLAEAAEGTCPFCLGDKAVPSTVLYDEELAAIPATRLYPCHACNPSPEPPEVAQ